MLHYLMRCKALNKSKSFPQMTIGSLVISDSADEMDTASNLKTKKSYTKDKLKEKLHIMDIDEMQKQELEKLKHKKSMVVNILLASNCRRKQEVEIRY